jgi:NAD-dependent SIR2 family protein deacetylase
VLWRQVFGPVRAGAITPTRSHRFLAELARRGILQRVYTQNVDGLETRAGVRETHQSCAGVRGTGGTAPLLAPLAKLHIFLNRFPCACARAWGASRCRAFFLPPEVPAELVVQCHGSIDAAYCAACGKGACVDDVLGPAVRAAASGGATSAVDGEESFPLAPAAPPPDGTCHPEEGTREEASDKAVPRCRGCGGVVRPDVTFFGEPLRPRFYECQDMDFNEVLTEHKILWQFALLRSRFRIVLRRCDADDAKCEPRKVLSFFPIPSSKNPCVVVVLPWFALGQATLVLVLGTTLRVYPFASLVGKARLLTPRVLMNREACGPFTDPVSLRKHRERQERKHSPLAKYFGRPCCQSAAALSCLVCR